MPYWAGSVTVASAWTGRGRRQRQRGAAPPAGCTITGFGFRPPSGVLTENTACPAARMMHITSYQPATLGQVDQLPIPDPPGSSVTFFSTEWDRTDTQALIEGLHDQTSAQDTSPGFRAVFLLRGGRLTGPLRTQAYGVTW